MQQTLIKCITGSSEGKAQGRLRCSNVLSLASAALPGAPTE
jgi:hypothetical protein